MFTGQREITGLGVYDYKVRFYSPYITQFTQPDTIVPNPYDPQDWNHYSYARNNPIRYTDPTGHSICGLDDSGACNNEERLVSYAYDTVKRLSRKNDLEAMARIVDKAAKLYHTYDKMIPMLSKIFLGVEESNPLTIYHAATANKCAAIGREPIDCPSNSPNEVFWDRGFNPDFQDTHNQVFHFWAYVATAASTDMKVGGFALGFYVGQGANIFHEILGYGDPAGASWQDFALAQAGMNTGEMIAFGLIPPNQLGNYIRDNIGNKGAPYVDTLKEFVPLPIWPFNYLAK